MREVDIVGFSIIAAILIGVKFGWLAGIGSWLMFACLCEWVDRKR